MDINSIENLIHVPICENIIKRYGKYTKTVNGELVKIIYNWFERNNGHQYKLSLTKEQYDQMKSIVFPTDADGKPLTFDEFYDILIPLITGDEHDHHDEHSIELAFRSFDKNQDQYIQADELENLIHIIGKSISREQIRNLINKVNKNPNGQLDYNEFRQFILKGYARELLMMDITKESL